MDNDELKIEKVYILKGNYFYSSELNKSFDRPIYRTSDSKEQEIIEKHLKIDSPMGVLQPQHSEINDSKIVNFNLEKKYNEMSFWELKSLLKERKINFTNKTKKKEVIELLQNDDMIKQSVLKKHDNVVDLDLLNKIR